jgi:hypothetical protein
MPLAFPRLIGFCGLAGHGKTTAARHLVSLSGLYAVRLSFADPIRQMLLAMGLSADDMSDPRLKETPHLLLGGKTPRQAMQSLGTDWGRRMVADDLWLNLARHRATSAMLTGNLPVFDDVRFDNEAAMIRALGGHVIRIYRPGQPLIAPVHASEAGIAPALINATLSAHDYRQLITAVDTHLNELACPT